MAKHTAPGIGSAELPTPDARTALDRWQPPVLEVICLACEISAYAPDGDQPLF